MRAWHLAAVVLGLSLVLGVPEARAVRCATVRASQDSPSRGFAPYAAAQRNAVPIEAPGVSLLVTEHFRILWGAEYDEEDVHWTEDAGVPAWIRALGRSLEHAFAALQSSGFAAPYGAERSLLDVYVANTGIVGKGGDIEISSGYCGYTGIDSELGAAYFIFNDDFSAFAHDELDVLRAAAAHELFHAVQRNYYPWEDRALVPLGRWNREAWWFEATATWMEEVCCPDVDDYVAFVREFLSRPELPLHSRSGSREYGAGIFPGYLWLRHGGARLWQRIFEDAYVVGLEQSLDSSLREGSGISFQTALARFWALAAHPEDTWPDGRRFCGENTPGFLTADAEEPLKVSATSQDAPARFGANLLRFKVSRSPVTVDLHSGESIEWQLSLSARGRSDAHEVLTFQSGNSVEFDAEPGAVFHLALVNVSSDRGQAYRAVIRGAEWVPESQEGVGRAGGCFLQSFNPR